MRWVMTFHLLFVISWFAGLFYLPRIFVNLAQTTDAATQNTLIGMGTRLYRFSSMLATLAIAFGLWLFLGYGLGAGQGWMHAKLAMVALLLVYHLVCGKYLTHFRHGLNRHSHVYFRWFNEVPVLFLLVILVLVIVKPF